LSYPEAPDLEATYQTELGQIETLAPPADAPEAAHSAHEAARRQLTEEYNTAVVERSIAGRVGRFIEPVFEPLGFNLRVTIGLIAALSAREVMVSALGVSYGMGEEVDEESGSLRAALAQDPEMSPAIALSLLVWFVFAFQCIATLAAVRRETRSWRWPLFLIGYQTVLAWVASFVTYRVATAAGLG
jgi:ferrous iron transport protein B